jgi:hypothetical protein
MGGRRSRGATDHARNRLRQGYREFVFGMTGYEFARQALETRAALETVFLAVTVGDMVGLPVMPPYYALRLLPHIVPQTATWRRQVAREREFTDEHQFDLHGV